ncbi:uncharacterized protein GGS25DRAFT_521395 [Hypoxylon fragiforme]|uniref:uncharacterized protein n=1 Tax=Hypoxylon fragiforme TaxID=63214 RepID=UPI0020C716D5|nr:uncharacterized protein GGS25DRAFT_521395 [Hypoxylon fragiforme]KAI2608220.1 hypothetical protein GGS25DRAFT_521395 [Hypoxylon fragiforme]
MKFSLVSSLIFIAATSVLASPLAASADGLTHDELLARDLVSLHTQDTGNGTSLEYFGVPDSTTKRWTPTPTLERRKSTTCSAYPTPSCDNKDNEAQNELCSSLVDNLYAQATIAIDQSWRQICFKGEGGDKCCTAWSTAVPWLRQGDLAANANTIMQTCTNNGVSGKMYGVRLQSTCLNQCVSSGHGCNNSAG